MLLLLLLLLLLLICISSQFFENQPNEICSHLSEKASKGMFHKPKKLQNHSNKGKGKEKKKERGEAKEEKKKKPNGFTLSFYNSYFEDPFGDSVIKNLARYIRIRLPQYEV